jgi:hypothetical protein
VIAGFTHPFVAIWGIVIALSWISWSLLFRYLQQPELWWHDSGRFEEWWTMLREWWRSTWWTILFGCGIRSWAQTSATLCHQRTIHHPNQRIFAMAHNEYIQQVFEYGLVGVLALMGYTGIVLWKAYLLHYGLFLVGVVMVSVAMMTFPWSFYHKVFLPKEQTPDGQILFEESRHGSPALFWITFMLVMLIEAH